MSNTTCLAGPAFSLTGNIYYVGPDVAFQVVFDTENDAAGVLAYQWYLDDLLVTGQNGAAFGGQLDCGQHAIGIRLLSGGDWSGIKKQTFYTCWTPVSALISGPDTVDEGTSATYYVIGTYPDGSTQDVTVLYTFSSSAGGSFSGNIFTAAVDNNNYQPLPVTITATTNGQTPINKQIIVNNTTPVTLVSRAINGPDSVDEGASASYSVIAIYSDGSQQDETSTYIFSCPEGSFSANVFTAATNNTAGDTRSTTITATKTGADPLTKAITIRDTSMPVVASIWVEDSTQSYCETKIVEESSISNFASPTNAAIAADHTLLYTDPTLDGVIYFNPLVISDGSQATLISLGSSSRPTGAYYHAPSDKLYVNAFRGGGLKVIDCNTKTLTKTITYGTDGDYSRGNIYYIAVLDEIWATGNSGFLRISAADETVVPSTAFSAQGSVYITSVNNKIYVFYDAQGNEVKVYDNSLNLITTISGLCSNTFVNGDYVSRGYYTDIVNQKIYVGENSSSGGITVIDATTDTISKRVALDKEGKTYASPGVISFHPLRNTVYIGGSLLDTAGSPLARLWAFDTLSETITQTIIPSGNTVVNSLIYYPPNNSVYAASAGQIPESDPNNNQFNDGVIFKFN